MNKNKKKEPQGKKSKWIGLGLAATATATAGFIAYHHPVVRDRYGSEEDCRADWGPHGHECTPEQTSSSGGGSSGSGSMGGARGAWLGPSYEQGDRPATARPWSATGADTVTRAGFGRTGARVSGGG
ncbi:hypothetical protein [Pseudorhodoferax sp.]|uniref:hypothetical protein n=1 Tax=Pseudorhodoferax sp. TaxID=1993553 RepID=UPI0039E72799